MSSLLINELFINRLSDYNVETIFYFLNREYFNKNVFLMKILMSIICEKVVFENGNKTVSLYNTGVQDPHKPSILDICM